MVTDAVKNVPLQFGTGSHTGNTANGVKHVRLQIGDVAVSSTPALLSTMLGSCVAVCLFDPVLQAGGMNHILLPYGVNNGHGARFGIHAMELLINKLMRLGAERRRLVAKAFGGASVLTGMHMLQIGEMNINFIKHFLSAEKIPLVASRLGGEHAVHVDFNTDTGIAKIRTVDGSALPKLSQQEISYWNLHKAVKKNQDDDSVTLFT